MGVGEMGKWVMGRKEGACWDEHWVLYGNQSDNEFHIKKKRKRKYIRVMNSPVGFIEKSLEAIFPADYLQRTQYEIVSFKNPNWSGVLVFQQKNIYLKKKNYWN